MVHRMKNKLCPSQEHIAQQKLHADPVTEFLDVLARLVARHHLVVHVNTNECEYLTAKSSEPSDLRKQKKKTRSPLK